MGSCAAAGVCSQADPACPYLPIISIPSYLVYTAQPSCRELLPPRVLGREAGSRGALLLVS